MIILKKLLLKNSKKFIALIIGLFLFPLVVKADHIYGGTVVVEWVDAEDKLGMRPDEIKIPVFGEYRTTELETIKRELVLNKKDAKITQEGLFTYWTFEVKFIDEKAGMGTDFQYDTSENFEIPKGYKLDREPSGNLGILGDYTFDGEEILTLPYDTYNLRITLVKDIYKNISLKSIFNDDNGRDNYRYIYFDMKGNNTEGTYYKFDSKFTKKVDSYTENLDDLIKYLVGDVGSSNILEKVQYEYKILDEVKNLTDDTYTYSVEADEDGNIIYTINHKAERIKIPIKVNWLDDNNIYQKRPNKLLIKTINQYDEVEEEVNLDKWQTDLELFKNIKYSFGEEQIEYNLKLDNTKDYEYEVIGDNKGFTINAKYIGDKTIPTSNVEDNNVLPPQTSDDIDVFISLILISISCIFISYRQLNKKN